MSAETQCKVACEFGYSENLVKVFLEYKRHKNAGELVDELENHLSKCEEEKEDEICRMKEEIIRKKKGKDDECSATDEEKIASVTFPLEDGDTALTLLEETQRLYKKSTCLVCRKNRRSIVLLPCSHLVICASCLTSSSTCPRRDCQLPIDCAIPTFF